ncbi:hypothetical protein ABZ281_32365 [Streptomyces sp. NPDC006265]|uniref:hypothetical protein n=1 Tax=Streptomyces sp. NPDC006265 TaxID=3156740 RepID=UPI0033AB9084
MQATTIPAAAGGGASQQPPDQGMRPEMTVHDDHRTPAPTDERTEVPDSLDERTKVLDPADERNQVLDPAGGLTEVLGPFPEGAAPLSALIPGDGPGPEDTEYSATVLAGHRIEQARPDEATGGQAVQEPGPAIPTPPSRVEGPCCVSART